MRWVLLSINNLYICTKVVLIVMRWTNIIVRALILFLKNAPLKRLERDRDAHTREDAHMHTNWDNPVE